MPSALDRLNAYVTHKSDADEAEFARRVFAYRAEVLHEAADALAHPIPEGAPTEDWADLIEAIEQIREMAEDAERRSEPGMHPKDFLRMFFNIPDETGKDTPAGATELGEFVPCIKDRCQRGEWSGKAAERGWEHQAGGGWLCPQCAGKVTTEQATP